MQSVCWHRMSRRGCRAKCRRVSATAARAPSAADRASDVQHSQWCAEWRLLRSAPTAVAATCYSVAHCRLLPCGMHSTAIAAAIPAVCTISSGANEAPQHQGGTHDRWVYPSEQQFYNAMRRKGWPADPGDMSNVVAIHNGVNERAWHQILKYEVRSRDACPPALLEGRWQD